MLRQLEESGVVRMIKEHLNLLCEQFGLGSLRNSVTRIYGGLLHIMWRLDTDKGSYAIKQLSKDIDLQDDQVIKNYELSERIASSFMAQDIPGVCALSQSDKHLWIIDGCGYLVYPWVNAKALGKDEINEDQALIIARLLAKMHSINLHLEGIGEPEFDIYDSKYIINLIKQSTEMQLPFADILNSNLLILLEINDSYLGSIEILKKYTVIGHGDLDQKNVLWMDKKKPLLIDWESACKLNPTYEIVNAALDWSGVTTDLKINLFHKILKSYSESGGLIEQRTVEAAFYGVMGNWINWMLYNINRAINQANTEQKNIGIEQVMQVLPTILRVKTCMPGLISEITEVNAYQKKFSLV
jgi:thiamine kinase-like enzyme